MATPPDPMDALNMFQRDLDRLELTPSEIDPDLFIHLDQPGGYARMTFVTLRDRTVTAMAVLFAADPTDGVLRFQGFFAVPEVYRNQGRAKDILRAALRHMAYGFARAKVDAIRVEVIVDPGNIGAQRVAAAAICPIPERITDEVSGLPILRYGATLKHTTH